MRIGIIIALVAGLLVVAVLLLNRPRLVTIDAAIPENFPADRFSHDVSSNGRGLPEWAGYYLILLVHGPIVVNIDNFVIDRTEQLVSQACRRYARDVVDQSTIG